MLPTLYGVLAIKKSYRLCEQNKMDNQWRGGSWGRPTKQGGHEYHLEVQNNHVWEYYEEFHLKRG